jgi:hypothetical protein
MPTEYVLYYIYTPQLPHVTASRVRFFKTKTTVAMHVCDDSYTTLSLVLCYCCAVDRSIRFAGKGVQDAKFKYITYYGGTGIINSERISYSQQNQNGKRVLIRSNT